MNYKALITMLVTNLVVCKVNFHFTSYLTPFDEAFFFWIVTVGILAVNIIYKDVFDEAEKNIK